MKILFLDILTDDPKKRRSINKIVYGGSNYSEETRRAFGLKKHSWFLLDATKNKFPKNISGFSGVVIGGSTEDPVDGKEKPWMKNTYKFINKIIKNDIPILGICGGLQFTVRALGGKIIFNPKGKEFGSVRIKMTSVGKSDSLFKGIPNNFFAQASHKCMAKNLKRGWRLLAHSNMCLPQAVAIGDHIRLLQFHPEMKKSQLKALARMRFDSLADPPKNTEKIGRKILRNFILYFVLSNGQKVLYKNLGLFKINHSF